MWFSLLIKEQKENITEKPQWSKHRKPITVGTRLLI